MIVAAGLAVIVLGCLFFVMMMLRELCFGMSRSRADIGMAGKCRLPMTELLNKMGAKEQGVGGKHEKEKEHRGERSLGGA